MENFKFYFELEIDEPMKNVLESAMKLNDIIDTTEGDFYEITSVGFIKDKHQYLEYLRNFDPIKFDLDSFTTDSGENLSHLFMKRIEAKKYEEMKIKASFKSQVYTLLSFTEESVIFLDKNEIIKVKFPQKRLRLYKSES